MLKLGTQIVLLAGITLACSPPHKSTKALGMRQNTPTEKPDEKDPDSDRDIVKDKPDEFQSAISSFVMKTPSALSASESDLAALGQKLFFDPSFSADGKISCATCHEPQKFFTDQRDVAVGMETGTRNTPTIVNSRFWTNFFWDGRASSINLQAIGPVENILEHGITRGRVAQVLYQRYKDEYEQRFGSFPSEVVNLVNTASEFEAAPKRPEFFLTDELANFVNDTVTDSDIESEINSYRDHGYSLRQSVTFVTSFYDSKHRDETDANRVYAGLNYKQKDGIDEVFLNFGKSVAAFEKTLVAVDSPFDRFANNLIEIGGNPALSFNEGFGSPEYEGYQLFTGKAGCSQCHNGPLFSDEQFHNIGLGSLSDKVDLGRAVGVLEGFFCVFESLQFKEECGLHLSGATTPYNSGAFRTASLRNLAYTAPYMHDGRYEDISEVLEHYNWLSNDPYVGRRSKHLWPIHLEDDELGNLEAFLMSLSSPVAPIQ
ncbi:MAG: cytochrome-c peroxidase [Oligoflexales bacterium]